MSEELSAERVKPHHNQDFSQSTLEGEGELTAQLVEVNELKGDTTRDDRTPFSLIFKGPQDVLHEQQCFKVAHPELGEHVIFIVPLGPDPEDEERRPLYEAVFT
ncbi:MAG: hypothetical protein AAF725_15030 [Acidobacteriota bacterium]